jgi:hypothetical protein
MKLKLDENLGELGRDVLTAQGHDVATVAAQRMSGSRDIALYEACRLVQAPEHVGRGLSDTDQSRTARVRAGTGKEGTAIQPGVISSPTHLTAP